MANELEALARRQLVRLQRHTPTRQLLALLCLAGLLILGGYFLYQSLPRQHTLRIAGSEVVSNRHYLMHILQEEVLPAGVRLHIASASDANDTMARLSRGELDLALMQDADAERYPNIRHIATLPTEVLHVLARPPIKQLSELRNRQINLEPRGSEWREHAVQALEFAGLHSGRDYLEANLDEEALMVLPGNVLPDAVVIASFIPSALVEFLIREHGYTLLELPFPASAPHHLDWGQASQIPAFAYGAEPAMPPRNLLTVGSSLHLVGHDHIDARATRILLHTLYGPALAARLHLPFEEKHLTDSAGYPLAAGVEDFIKRNHPLISKENYDKFKSLGGMLFSLASALLVALKWFRGEPVIEEE